MKLTPKLNSGIFEHIIMFIFKYVGFFSSLIGLSTLLRDNILFQEVKVEGSIEL